MLSADGKAVAVRERGSVSVYDAADPSKKSSIPDPAGVSAVPTAAFAVDGHLLAVGRSDGSVVVWDAGAGKDRATAATGRAGLRAAAVSPDGRWIAVGGTFADLVIWDAAAGAEKAALKASARGINLLTFAGDGKMIAGVCPGDQAVRLWALERDPGAGATPPPATVAVGKEKDKTPTTAPTGKEKDKTSSMPAAGGPPAGFVEARPFAANFRPPNGYLVTFSDGYATLLNEPVIRWDYYGAGTWNNRYIETCYTQNYEVQHILNTNYVKAVRRR
jgi:WD40 repeat protein